MTRLFTLPFIGLCLSVAMTGCANNSTQLEVRYAAQKDLRCDSAELELTLDRPHEKRVEGCGRVATYMRDCRNASRAGADFRGTDWGFRDCQWARVPMSAEAEEEALSSVGDNTTTVETNRPEENVTPTVTEREGEVENTATQDPSDDELDDDF